MAASSASERVARKISLHQELTSLRERTAAAENELRLLIETEEQDELLQAAAVQETPQPQAAAAAAAASSSSLPKNALLYADISGQLKTVDRAGWVRRGIDNPESVASHSWRMAALCFLFMGEKKKGEAGKESEGGEDSIDFPKLMQLCIVHDLAEVIVGKEERER
jgi:hypothetical protein